jgi:hypothetical protein
MEELHSVKRKHYFVRFFEWIPDLNSIGADLQLTPEENLSTNNLEDILNDFSLQSSEESTRNQNTNIIENRAETLRKDSTEEVSSEDAMKELYNFMPGGSSPSSARASGGSFGYNSAISASDKENNQSQNTTPLLPKVYNEQVPNTCK